MDTGEGDRRGETVMGAVGDLDQILAQMRPRVNPGRYVFVSITGAIPTGVSPVMSFHEDEGLTLIVTRDQADAAGLGYDLVTAWITLTVHSALDSVGLTAAVSAALAAADISCNVVAATHHDHLFVPAESADAALSILERLSRRCPSG
jgi:hypothetical protein